MVDVMDFVGMADIDIGEFSPKSTTRDPGQKEASKSLWMSADGLTNVGIWECTPGRFTSERPDNSEVCLFLSGKVELSHSDGNRRTFIAGEMAILPLGWRGEWSIVETTRKIYISVSQQAN